MEGLWNWKDCGGKYQNNENLRTAVPNTVHDRSKTEGECGIFQLHGQHDYK